MDTPINNLEKIAALLGEENRDLLNYRSQTIPNEKLHRPGPDHIDEVFTNSDRNAQVLRNLGALYNSGRLAGTGYLSILPVDQGIEHTAGSSFAPNPDYFDPENIIKLAIEGG